MEKDKLAAIAIVALSFALSAYFYPQVPDLIATHWNAQGAVDAYTPKVPGLLILPVLILLLAVLFDAVPRLDPLRENIEKFRSHYNWFIILILLFMLLLHAQVILWNIGIQVSPNATLPIGLGILFFYIGVLLGSAKRNWFIGIRTPWTMSSDVVWEKTHRVGSLLFKIAGAICLAGVFFEKLAIYFVIIPVLSVAAFTFAYSYLEYRKEMKKKPPHRQ
ncbi:MAG TPA: SdpI family protein [Candidatus Diapherotrites archaeon]|uniref:SdpI family protein n=1 Tax=Candidatus Iainarchaeum sp. TaxID=3101447 RepID=A0A7J4IZ13_9ARCH|nr:SdpI family protein [Candidatus Diapherotrites archaeon]